jgi:hypothetical protein
MESHSDGNVGRESQAHIRKWGKIPRAHNSNRRFSNNSEEYPQPLLRESVTRTAVSFDRTQSSIVFVSTLRNSLEVVRNGFHLRIDTT